MEGVSYKMNIFDAMRMNHQGRLTDIVTELRERIWVTDHGADPTKKNRLNSSYKQGYDGSI